MNKRLFALIVLALWLATPSAIARPTAPREPANRGAFREFVLRIIHGLGPALQPNSNGDSMTPPKP